MHDSAKPMAIISDLSPCSSQVHSPSTTNNRNMSRNRYNNKIQIIEQRFTQPANQPQSMQPARISTRYIPEEHARFHKMRGSRKSGCLEPIRNVNCPRRFIYRSPEAIDHGQYPVVSSWTLTWNDATGICSGTWMEMIETSLTRGYCTTIVPGTGRSTSLYSLNHGWRMSQPKIILLVGLVVGLVSNIKLIWLQLSLLYLRTLALYLSEAFLLQKP